METAMSRAVISGAQPSEFTSSILLALFETSANDAKRANTRETSRWTQFISEALRRRAVPETSRWAQFIGEALHRDQSGRTPFTTIPDIGTDESDSLRIFNAIQTLYLSRNHPRDRQIAERITDLHRVVLGEGEQISAESLEQFTEFFRDEPELAFPRITMTPEGTLRARWIHDRDHFVAIEFTGKPLVRLIAEVPRDGGQTASYFGSEPIESVVAASRKLGACF
jgi:hypothetical protein